MIRDEIDEVFNTLPPPKPSRNNPSPSPATSSASYSVSSPSYSGSSYSVSSMAMYNSYSNPCFHGNSTVAMADGSLKLVKVIPVFA